MCVSLPQLAVEAGIGVESVVVSCNTPLSTYQRPILARRHAKILGNVISVLPSLLTITYQSLHSYMHKGVTHVYVTTPS